MRLPSNYYRAFSLVELLVALSILSVVAGLIIPRFFNMRESATDASAMAQASALNSVYQQWRSMGGKLTFTGDATTADTMRAIWFLQETGNSQNDRGVSSSPLIDAMDALGSRSVSVSPMGNNGATAIAINATMADGVYIAGAGSALPVSKLGDVYLKVAHRVYPIRLNSDIGFYLFNPYTDALDLEF